MKPPASDPSAHGPDEVDPLDLEALHDLLDERLDDAASAALRARLQREPALQACWQELCELRELLRAEWSDETPTPIDPRALAERVLGRARELAPAAPAVELRRAPAAGPAWHRSRWFRIGLSFTAAASVCAAAIWLAALPQEAAPASFRAEVGDRAELPVRARAEDLSADSYAFGGLRARDSAAPAWDPPTFGEGGEPDRSAPAVGNAAEPAGSAARRGSRAAREEAPGAVAPPGAPVVTISEPEPRARRQSEPVPSGETPGAPETLRLGASASGTGGGGGGSSEREQTQGAVAAGGPPSRRWEDAAGEVLRLEILRNLGGGLQVPEAPAVAESPERAGVEAQLQESVQEGGGAATAEAEQGTSLDSLALSVVRQLDVAADLLEPGEAQDESDGSASGDAKGAERAKAKSAEVSASVEAPAWTRLVRSWSAIDPRSQLEQERLSEDRKRPAAGRAAEAPAGASEAEPILLLRFASLAPEQIARASSALRARGFAASGFGSGGSESGADAALRFRSVLAPVDVASAAPSIFVGWLETTSDAPAPNAPLADLDAIVGTEPNVAQLWVQLGDFERAISTATKVEDLSRRGLAMSEAPSVGTRPSSDAEARKLRDAARGEERQPGGPGGAPGLRGGVSLSRELRAGVSDPELSGAQSKSEVVGPAGGPGTSGSAGRATPAERITPADPARPGAPSPTPSPTPARAVRVLAILEPKRGG